MADRNALLIKHSTTWSGDRCSAWLEAQGYTLQWCYPTEGDTLPDPARYDIAVVYGGRASVNDEEEWIARECRWLEHCLNSDCHFLGICFGAQLLAKVLGARVWRHPQLLKEIGFTTVTPSDISHGFLPGAMKLFQWHGDGFDLPADCELLATGDRFPNQAFRHGERALAVQFHPEVNHHVASQWLGMNQDFESEFLDPESRAGHLSYALEHDDAITAWLDGVLSEWLKRQPN